MNVLAGIDFQTVEEFVTALNKARLGNKDKWIVYRGHVNGKLVEVKSFNLLNQIIRVNGVTHPEYMI